MVEETNSAEDKKYSSAKTEKAKQGQVNQTNVKLSRTKIELISLAGNIYNQSPNSRLVFAGQALRMIKEEFIPHEVLGDFSNCHIVITMAILNAKPTYYTPEQQALMKQDLMAVYNDLAQNQSLKTQVKEIRLCVLEKGLAEITQYINQGKDYPRSEYKIGRLDIFTHGIPGRFLMADHLDENVPYQLTMENGISAWSKEGFHKKAKLHSWACRTCAPNHGQPSLAEEMANHLQIPVYGFQKKSDYADTWGSRDDRSILRKCNNPHTLGLFMSKEEEASCQRLQEEYQQRTNSLRDLRAIWMDDGAVHPVKCGTSPSNLPEGRYVAKPGIQGVSEVNTE